MKKELFIQLAVVSLCLLFSAAFADQHDGLVIYVNATIGSDSYTGLTPVPDAVYMDHGPKKTIMGAVFGQHTARNATIFVADGIYHGEDNINFAHILEEKFLTLRSANGPENCIIDCGAQPMPFQFLRPHNHGEPVAVMDGFTIVNARQAAVKFGNGSATTIANCVLSGNVIDADFGVITCRNQTTASIVNCTIENNIGEHNSAGITCTNSAPTITGCSVVATAGPIGQPTFAISSYNALPTITGCTIRRSTGIGIEVVSDDGVVPEYAMPVRISDCTLTNNLETAIHVQGDAVISNCLISGNWAPLGAGIYVGDPLHLSPYDENDGVSEFDVTIRGCTITDNTAESAPAIYCLHSNVKVDGCLVSGNYASNYDVRGPGHCGASAILGYFGNFEIFNSVITANYGENISGYAVSFFGGPIVHVDNSTISGNVAFETGGGICFLGEGGYNQQEASFTVENCEVLGNITAWQGNQILAREGVIRIANCVVVDEVDEQQSSSDAVRVARGNAGQEEFLCEIVNCTILSEGKNNSHCLFAQGPVNITNSILWYDGYNYGSIIYGDLDNVNVSYSNVQDRYFADIVGNGNISQPPLFADSIQATPQSRNITLGEDFHLKSQAGRYDSATDSWVQGDVTSPGIDAGDPTMHVGAEPLSSGGRINLGAYGGTQYASKTDICTGPIVGDLNNDCTVDLTDFAKMAGNWLGSTIEQP